MRNDRIIPGLILVMLGALFLLHNYGLIHFHWANFVYLWPIFIIIGGVNLIFAHNRSPWATALKIGVVVLGFGLLVFGNFEGRHWWPAQVFSYHSDDKDDDDDDETDTVRNTGGVVKVEGNSFFNQPYTSDARTVRLNISGGATTYTLNDTTNQLFSANTKEFKGRYEFDHHKDGDSVYVLDFHMRKNQHFNFDDRKDHKSNEAILKLNPNPQWDINVETGAAETNLDLTKFKVRNVKLQGGAATFNVKLGQPLALTQVDVKTGMADVTINVPKNAACRITKSTGLSSSDFNGFTEKNDGYETPGYASAKNKIQIDINAGLSNFKVSRY